MLWNRIQNDLITSIKNVILQNIKNSIQNSFISIMADETTDVGQVEQLSIVFRYFDEKKIDQLKLMLLWNECNLLQLRLFLTVFMMYWYLWEKIGIQFYQFVLMVLLLLAGKKEILPANSRRQNVKNKIQILNIFTIMLTV